MKGLRLTDFFLIFNFFFSEFKFQKEKETRKDFLEREDEQGWGGVGGSLILCSPGKQMKVK